MKKKLWTNDAEYYEDRLVEDALLLFGETGVISKKTAIEAIRGENAEGRRWAAVEFADERVVELSPGVAALLYKAAARWEHESKWIFVLASSIYVKRGEGWKLALHQQTPLQEGEYQMV